MPNQFTETTEQVSEVIGLHQQLIDLPIKLQDARLKLAVIMTSLRGAEARLAELTYEIEKEVAFNYELRNDRQRDVRRYELQQSDEYQAALKEVQDTQDLKVEIDIEIELLRNQFAATKLKVRHVIAEIEQITI